MVFPVVMYGCESWTINKESWAHKNWCFWIVVLEKTLESPLDCKEIQPVNLKRNQSWIFTGKIDAEAEDLILWPPDAKSRLIEKTLILGKIDSKRRRGWQRIRWLDVIIDSTDMSLGNSRRQWRTEKPGVLQFLQWQTAGHNLETERPHLLNVYNESNNIFSSWINLLSVTILRC